MNTFQYTEFTNCQHTKTKKKKPDRQHSSVPDGVSNELDFGVERAGIWVWSPVVEIFEKSLCWTIIRRRKTQHTSFRRQLLIFYKSSFKVFQRKAAWEQSKVKILGTFITDLFIWQKSTFSQVQSSVHKCWRNSLSEILRCHEYNIYSETLTSNHQIQMNSSKLVFVPNLKKQN